MAAASVNHKAVTYGEAFLGAVVPISCATWALLAVGQPLTELVVEDIDEEAGSYVTEHMGDLDGRALRSPPTHFIAGADKKRFDLLRRGSEAEFLSASQELAGRLLGQMRDSRQDGLFVAAREIDKRGAARAAVLKLHVVAPHTGYLQRVKGRIRLGAVKAALNVPGQLQKGALYPDVRRNSAVVVGDQLDVSALYFLRSLGLVQDQSPKRAVAAVYSAVRSRVPDAEQAVADSIATRRPTSVKEALDGLVSDLPPLSPMRLEIESELKEQARPPVALDPDRAGLLKRVISGGGIEISGSVSAMRSRVEGPVETDDGRWRVVVTFDGKPSDRVAS